MYFLLAFVVVIYALGCLNTTLIFEERYLNDTYTFTSMS